MSAVTYSCVEPHCGWRRVQSRPDGAGFAIGAFAPQVAMLQAWWIAAIEVVLIAGTFSHASTVPAGACFWRRAFAGLTMCAFLVMVGNAVAVFALLFFIGSLFATSS